MSFFERFRSASRHEKEKVEADPDRKAALDSFHASLVEVEDLDLVREKEGLKVEIELEEMKVLEQRDSQKIEQATKRIQDIEAEMERARNQAAQ